MGMRGGPGAKENISADMRVLEMLKTSLTYQEKFLATNSARSDVDEQDKGSIRGLRAIVHDVYTICK